MADRPRNGAGGAFGANQPYKTFYFVLVLATVFTVRDIFLSESNTGGGGERGKMSSESGSESDGGMGDDGLRQRRFDDEPRPESSAGLKLAAGSKLSAGKLGGPVMKFMYCTS
ncbi:unnamed protein product [Orchesella dallaii]|uniref:Uncharacterized protein n=1 Tax=Orchesella dallaii TaxID=48710 RepID=A0ABP1R3M5_9HEXA